MFEIEYRINEDMIERAQRHMAQYYHWNKPIPGLHLLFYFLLIPPLFFIGILVFKFTWLTWVQFMIALAVIDCFRLAFKKTKKITTFETNVEHPSSSNPYRVKFTFTENVLEVASSGILQTHSWRDFSKLFKADDLWILLFKPKSRFYFWLAPLPSMFIFPVKYLTPDIKSYLMGRCTYHKIRLVELPPTKSV